MDPVANIREQRQLAQEVLDLMQPGELSRDTLHQISVRAERLAELVQALDEWRTGGGFDPYPVGQ